MGAITRARTRIENEPLRDRFKLNVPTLHLDFVRWMIREGYEDDPCIRDGDIFANNDAFIGTLQVPDAMDVVPIFHSGKPVGRAGAVCREPEAGGITPGGDVALAQERFTEGLFVCAEKIGENDEIRRDYVIRCERNLRMPICGVLDEKAKAASRIDMRESVKTLIDEIGLDTWMRVSKEFIEEGRRAQLARTRQLTVPGRYRGHTCYGHVTAGKPGCQPLGDPDWLYNMPVEMEIGLDGTIPRLDGDRAEAAQGHLDQPRQRARRHRHERGAAPAGLRRLPAPALARFLGAGLRGGGLRPGQLADDRDGRHEPVWRAVRHGAFRMRGRGLRRPRHQGRARHGLCRLEPGVRHGRCRDLGAEHADALSRPLDILVNAAGTTAEQPVCGHPDALWQKIIDTGLTGAFRTIRALLRGMIARKWGRIVNIGSTAATVGWRETPPTAPRKPACSASPAASRWKARRMACPA